MTTAAQQTRSNAPQTMISAGCALALAWIYYPTFAWMYDRWDAPDSYFAHGFIIPIVSLVWVWKKRDVLKLTEKEPSYTGLPLIAAGVFLQIFSSLFRIYFVSAFSLVAIIAGGVLCLYGRKVFREVWYPVAFLLLMIPLPLLAISEITLKLKFIVSELAVFFLQRTGLETHREGSYIVLPNAYLLVGDPCSGLRSFLAFLCLGFIFAYGGKLSPLSKLVLIVSGLPLAILSNLLRVYALGLIAEVYGQEAAGGKVHDASGVIVFILAFICFMLIRSKLEGSHAKA